MRRRGRVCALQVLYQMDLAREFGAGQHAEEQVSAALRRYWGSFDAVGEDDRRFAERLVTGVARELPALDAALTEVAHNWRLPRMGAVDRNLLRLSAYELLYCADIPRAACINEAIEIAKRFSGNDSAGFINGILDQIAKRRTEPDVPKDMNVESG